jgi:hypothetical protein
MTERRKRFASIVVLFLVLLFILGIIKFIVDRKPIASPVPPPPPIRIIYMTPTPEGGEITAPSITPTLNQPEPTAEFPPE